MTADDWKVLTPTHRAGLALLVLLIIGATVASGSAQASTSVSGLDAPNAALEIDAGTMGTDPQESGIGGTSKMVAFIAEMPATKTVNEVTLGDLRIDGGSKCPRGNPSTSLFVAEHPTGSLNVSSPNWQADAGRVVVPTSPGPVTWNTEPFTLVEGRAYSIWLNVFYTYCTVYSKSWEHAPGPIASGQERCSPVWGSSVFRMWHEHGESDAVKCPGGMAGPPTGFSADLPTGWLLVRKLYGANDVGIVNSATDECPSGGAGDLAKTPWAGHAPKLVCVFERFVPFGEPAPEHGWFWAAGSPGTRDINLRAGLDGPSLATWLKPSILFDSSEKWRPVNLESFFAETWDGLPAHSLCAFDTCTPVTDPDQLHTLGGYERLNVFGDEEFEELYRTPYAGCWVGGVLDCNAGASSSLYWRVTPTTESSSWRFVQYWAFYRFNSFSDSSPVVGTHEGDWEAVAAAVSQNHPGTFQFASFASHGAWYSYLRSTLRCVNTPNRTCGTDSSPQGQRFYSYVANGSHASYPQACSETIAYFTCGQPGNGFPERGHDGARPWGNNDPYAGTPVGLAPMPVAEDGWTFWDGEWGISDGPSSPGNQAAYDQSWGVCGEDDAGCPLPAIRARTTPSVQRAATHCGNWFGADIVALLCDESALRGEMESGSFSDSSLAHIRQPPASWRLGKAAGLTQAVGKPLRVGDHLTVRIAAGRRASLFLRALNRGRVREKVVVGISGRVRVEVRGGARGPRIQVSGGGVPGSAAATGLFQTKEKLDEQVG